MTLFEVGSVIMPLYIESAQQYLQLSIGALALSIAFKEKVLGEEGQKNVSFILAASWVLYLFTIGASSLYQYAAVKDLRYVSEYPGDITFLQRIIGPSELFGFMLFFFFFASTLLIVASGMALFKHKKS